MFETIFPFRLANKESGELGFSIHRYVFKTPKNRTIIFEGHLHEKSPLAVVKFYDKAYRLSKDKYSLKTNYHEAPGIIRTAIEIMLSIYKSNPYHSFAFMGAADIGESNNETQRFRVYQNVLTRLFTEIEFQHITNPSKSLYILLNRNYCSSNQNGQKEIFEALSTSYPQAF